MTELFAGRYAFVDLLGSGGMGTVWRVWDERSRAYCAAKVLNRADSTSLLRFIRETSWRVQHEHVLTPIGWAAEDDRVLFTMPLLRGGTVGDLVKDFGVLPDPLAGYLLRQLLEALRAVHETGLVHRDVKPSNLLLDPPGSPAPRLLLSDFGIAAHVDDPRLTRMGEAVGTLGYVAPEVLRGADPAPAQDLYAAGVVAHELLTGQRPPRAGTVDIAALDHHPLRGLVARLVAADPAARPTADAALAALAAVDLHGSAEPDEVEVFEHVPPLPDGWGAIGPIRDPAPVARATREPEDRPVDERTLTAPTEPAAPTAATALLDGPGPAPTTHADPPPAPDRGRRRIAPIVLSVLLIAAGVTAIALGLALVR